MKPEAIPSGTPEPCPGCGQQMIDFGSHVQHWGQPCEYWTGPILRAPKPRVQDRDFRAVATMVAEGIEDQTRGEVSDMGWGIEHSELMHAEFTCDGKRYRVEMREITGSENMEEPKPRVQTWLDCDHCGDVAIESADGVFTDGDGGACASCGLPGHVSCCSETEPHWLMSEDPNTKCTRADCEECNASQD